LGCRSQLCASIICSSSSQRKVARLQLDATRFAKLYEKVLAGDVGAMKELGKVLDRHDLAELDAVVRGRSGEAGGESR
jgi:hypothetical protein